MLAISVFLAVALDVGLVRFGTVFRLLYFVLFAIPGMLAPIIWGYLLVPLRAASRGRWSMPGLDPGLPTGCPSA